MDRIQQDRTIGVLAFMGCALCWSIAGLFIKILDWNPFLIAGIRSLIASLVLLAWIKKPRFTWSTAQIGAGVSYALAMLMFVIANKLTSAANAILLQYTAPIYAAFLGAVFLKEKPAAEHWVAFVFSALGMGLCFLGGKSSGRGLIGDLLALGSGVAFAVYFVFMRAQKEGSPFESSLLSHWITAAVALPVACFLPAPHITAGSIFAIVVLGTVQIGLASIFFCIGVKRVSVVQGMLLSNIEPAANPLWVFLATGEIPAAASIAGGVVIIAAVTGAALVSVHRQSRAAAAA